jgi:hypothetical protein
MFTLRSSAAAVSAVLLSVMSLAAVADDAPAADAAKPAEPAKPAAPQLSDVLDASGIALSGYVDASYQHLSGLGVFSSGVADRVFDAHHDSFALQQASFTVAKQPKEGFGYVLNVTMGNDADVIAPFDFNGASKFDVTQAFGQYAMGQWTVIAGKYVTLAGSEVIASTGNTNFTRSILFGYAIPFTHTGVRATYAVNDMFSFTFGVNNGWDDVKDTNSSKTGEVAMSLTPVKGFTILAQGYFGKERVGGGTSFGPEGERNLIDVVATWNATDKLTAILNVDYGEQQDAVITATGTDKAKWDGAAAYLNYQFTDQWRISGRVEYFDDKDGYRTGIVQKWKEGTVTFGYAPAKNFELRIEGRYDKSDQLAFVKDDTGNLDDNQTSVALEALYKM